MKQWYEICDALIDIEGGFVNNPADKGGPTKYGITEAVARANGYHGPMEDMPVEVAQTVYRTRYWVAPGFSQVHEVSPVIAVWMLQCGVNMGQHWPGLFLQRALNVLNRGGRDFQDVEKDGSIGPKTVWALKTYLERRGMPGASVMLNLLIAQQRVRYMEIAEADPSQEEFEFGWQGRELTP